MTGRIGSKMNKSLTLSDAAALLEPRGDEALKEQLEGLWGGREKLSPIEILELDCEAFDKLKIVLNFSVIGEKLCRTLAHDFAMHVLPRWEEAFPAEKNPNKALGMIAQYLKGDATVEELKVAEKEFLDFARADDHPDLTVRMTFLSCILSAFSGNATGACFKGGWFAASCGVKKINGLAGSRERIWHLSRTMEVIAHGEKPTKKWSNYIERLRSNVDALYPVDNA